MYFLQKNSGFGVDFSYLQSFFEDIISHTLVIDLSERIIVLYDRLCGLQYI